MSNALRNSIILTILLILMLSGFLLVHRRYNKQAGILEAQNKKTEATIADLDEKKDIAQNHVSEALSYRPPESTI